MRNIDIFVSPHGASFAAAIFMFSPQKLFELTTKNSRHLADALGLGYSGYPLKNEKGELVPWYIDYDKPITFDVDDVVQTLGAFLNSD